MVIFFIMLTKDVKEHVKIQSKRNPVYGNRNGDSLLMILGLQTLNPFKAKDLKDVLEFRFQYLRIFWYQCVKILIAADAKLSGRFGDMWPCVCVISVLFLCCGSVYLLLWRCRCGSGWQPCLLCCV